MKRQVKIWSVLLMIVLVSSFAAALQETGAATGGDVELSSSSARKT